MKNVLYLKFGELTLKGKNRQHFTNCLAKNIKLALKGYSFQFNKEFDCFILSEFNSNHTNEMIQILKYVPGIYYIIKGDLIPNDLPSILAHTRLICDEINQQPEIKTFRINAHRHDKNYPIKSEDMIGHLANIILTSTPLKVSLKNHDWCLNIEIRSHEAIMFSQRIKGLGGLPVGSNGKVLVLLSGGIDSPVASKLLMNRGMHVDFLTFITPPHTSHQAYLKTKDLARKITLDNKLEIGRHFVCDFTKVMHELSHISNESYRITLMRRYFLKVGQYLAHKYNYDALATGDALGQVASQTIESMTVISQVIDSPMILRPLIAFDKEKIIDLAKFYQTYEISILPYQDSCSVFAPKSPTTKPKLENVKKLEKELELINSILELTINNHLKEEDHEN